MDQSNPILNYDECVNTMTVEYDDQNVVFDPTLGAQT